MTQVNATPEASYDLGVGLIVPPPNTGNGVTPKYNNASGVPVSGATTNAALDAYTRQAVYTAPTGEKFFSQARAMTAFSRIPPESSTF